MDEKTESTTPNTPSESESEFRYQKIVEDFLGFIVRWRPGGHRTFVSDNYLTYFGVTRDQIAQTDFTELIHPADREKVLQKVQKITADNPVISDEHRVITASGEVRWMEWTERGIYDELGNLKEYQSIGYDIHDRKLTQETLEQAKKNAEKAANVKDEFLATLSHEIRTPMHSVIGYLDLLSATELSEQQKFYTDKVKRNSKILVSLLDDVLNFVRSESLEIELKNENVDIEQLIDDTIDMTRRNLKSASIELSFEKDILLKNINIDPIRFQQVAFNLINNAIKYTHQGKINICLRQTSTSIDLEVSDTGIGISNEDQLKIFKPFVQADMSSTKNYEGAGLGLYIVKRIVDTMKGHIKINSELGVGTTFQVSIPFQ